MKLHDRVHLVNPDSQHFGRIVGLATEIERHNLWLVSLDQGFWSEDKQIFVRVLPVHEDNLELVEGTKPSLQARLAVEALLPKE